MYVNKCCLQNSLPPPSYPLLRKVWDAAICKQTLISYHLCVYPLETNDQCLLVTCSILELRVNILSRLLRNVSDRSRRVLKTKTNLANGYLWAWKMILHSTWSYSKTAMVTSCILLSLWHGLKKKFKDLITIQCYV